MTTELCSQLQFVGADDISVVMYQHGMENVKIVNAQQAKSTYECKNIKEKTPEN
jgi:hypothetical protein